MVVRVVIFDAYGTLFDVNAAARAAATQDPRLLQVWQQLSDDWRAKQLEYSWLRTIAGSFISFRQVTEDGLDWAMEKAKLSDPALKGRLMALYDELSPYPEARACLETLKEMGFATGILSNGSTDMLGSAVSASELGELLDHVLSVDAVETFKPAQVVYDLVGARFGTAPDDVLFVSSNGWDVTHASAYGFKTAWVNRAGAPLDRVGAAPDQIIDDLSNVPHIAGAT